MNIRGQAATPLPMLLAMLAAILVAGCDGSTASDADPQSSVDKTTYGTDYAFYRSPRTGHLLAGLGVAPAPATSQKPVFAGE